MKKKQTMSPVTFFNSKVTTTISISLVLVLLGLIIMLAILARNLSSSLKENLSFDIILSDEIKDAEVDILIKQLKSTEYIKSAEYISKAKAAKQLEADIGQNLEEFLGFNPLPGIIVANLRSEYTHSNYFPEIETKIKQLSPCISSIEFRKELTSMVNENFRKISAILLSIAALLLVISFALINNTIRLTIYSNRFLIHTMKLVGATEGFIRKPFVITQIITGFLSALIAIVILFWGFFYVSKDIKELWGVIDKYSLFLIAGSVIFLGITISVSATHFAVNRYLRMKVDDLFLV